MNMKMVTKPKTPARMEDIKGKIWFEVFDSNTENACIKTETERGGGEGRG